MAEDWAIDVRRYAPDAEDGVVEGIVRHCGIALRSRDASLVSFTDPGETDLVRESFLRKKLGLTHSDAELDAAIAEVGERMKGDTTRNRVTVYYLLAERFGKLGLFGAAASTAAAAAATPVEPAAAPPPPPPPPQPVAAPPPPPPPRPVAPAVAAAPLITAHAAAPRRERDDGVVGTAVAAFGLLGVAIIGTAALSSLAGNRSAPAPVISPAIFDAPRPVAAIPEGSGVVAEEVAGRPQLSVYFDTASAQVDASFAEASAPVREYLAANPGTVLVVSGYNDPRGDAAFNAELSKNRAQGVAAELRALGVPEGSIVLEKPAETTDAATTLANARRVDVVIRDAR